MRIGSIFMIMIVVSLIYVLPLISAKFQGSHTMEFNVSTGVDALECTACHSDILSQLTATTEAQRVFQVHRNAAGNSTYVGQLNANITNSTENDVCSLCHLAQVSGGETHTQVVVRPCTDLDCHGNNETTNNTLYPVAGNVSAKLGSVKNAHERWFDGMSGVNHTFKNETGVYYTNDFLACLGCHTGVGMNINSTEELYPHSDSTVTDPRRYF